MPFHILAESLMSGATAVEVSVVIPVYRSAATLPELAPRLMAVLDQVAESYEIVFVDDCSPDDSWSVVQSLQRQFPDRVSAVQLMRNFGQHNALMSGFRHATGQFIVTMDDDLQHPPEEIPKLLQALKSSELDLVYGAYEEKRHALGRNLGSALVRWFYSRVFGNKVRVSSFRAMRRQLIENIRSYNLNFTYLDGLLAWHTKRIGETLVRHEPRHEGRSGYSFGKLLELALNLFTNFSMGPLRHFVTGVLVGTAGLCGRRLLFPAVSGLRHYGAGLCFHHHRHHGAGRSADAGLRRDGRVPRAIAPEHQPQAAVFRAQFCRSPGLGDGRPRRRYVRR